MVWWQRTWTHENSHTQTQNCCVPISQCINSSNKYLHCCPPLWYYIWLNGPHNIYRAARNCFSTLLKAIGCFAKSYWGVICFHREKNGLQGCRFKSQSTYKRFPIRWIVLTKGLVYSVRMRHNYTSFIMCVGKLSSKLEVFQMRCFQCLQQGTHRLHGYSFLFCIRTIAKIQI